MRCGRQVSFGTQNGCENFVIEWHKGRSIEESVLGHVFARVARRVAGHDPVKPQSLGVL